MSGQHVTYAYINSPRTDWYERPSFFSRMACSEVSSRGPPQGPSDDAAEIEKYSIFGTIESFFLN